MGALWLTLDCGTNQQGLAASIWHQGRLRRNEVRNVSITRGRLMEEHKKMCRKVQYDAVSAAPLDRMVDSQ